LQPNENALIWPPFCRRKAAFACQLENHEAEDHLGQARPIPEFSAQSR
jgi:hypothetical protein